MGTSLATGDTSLVTGGTSLATGDTSLVTGGTSLATGGTSLATGDTSLATGGTSLATGPRVQVLPQGRGVQVTAHYCVEYQDLSLLFYYKN